MPRIVKKTKDPVIRMLKPGMCEANCTVANCPRGMQPILEFAPAECNMNWKPRAGFLKIAKALEGLLDDPDVVDLLKQMGVLRKKNCLTCRLIAKKTRENPDKMKGMCRAKWHELKAKLEEVGCVECGCNDSMTVEHTNPKEKRRNKKGKPVCLSDHTKWSVLGGTVAMQAEYDKPSVVPMCMNCQLMQPTHTAMKPKLDPKDLPDGKQGKNATEEEVAAHSKKYHLTQRRAKQAYVDPKKLAIGQCAECEFRVVPRGDAFTPGVTGYPHAFQWAHRSELDKEDGVAKIVNSAKSFATAKPLLDKEMARSRMLCQCCGKTETDKRKGAPGPSEEGN